MAWRCTEKDVKELIDSDDEVNFRPFIILASNLTDRIAAQDADSVLGADDLKDIEKLLAAYFYEFSDQQPVEIKTGDASAVLQGEFGKGLELNKWGQAAMLLDETGYLASLQKRKTVVSMEWLGLAPSQQTDYEDRD